jgi:hypothetical protein
MGGNPYDLIDNKNQEQSSVVAPTNVQAEQSVPVVSQPVQAVVPENNQVNVNIPVVAPVRVVPVQQLVAPVVKRVKKDVGPSGFTKKFISFIAKLSGQPDPQT